MNKQDMNKNITCQTKHKDNLNSMFNGLTVTTTVTIEAGSQIEKLLNSKKHTAGFIHDVALQYAYGVTESKLANELEKQFDLAEEQNTQTRGYNLADQLLLAKLQMVQQEESEENIEEELKRIKAAYKKTA